MKLGRSLGLGRSATARFGSGYLILACLVSSTHVDAIEWPKDYAPLEKTISPSGRFGTLALSRERAYEIMDKDSDADNWLSEENFLADLKEHRVLASIPDGLAYEGKPHCWVETQWSADESWCLAGYGFLWGYAGFVLLKKTDDQNWETRNLDKEMSQGYGEHFREGISRPAVVPEEPGGTVLDISTSATDNPHDLPDRATHYRVFVGRYDMVAKRWLSEEFGNASEVEAFFASGDWNAMDREAQSEADRSGFLDKDLNAVYGLLRDRLKPDRFAALRNEEKLWLQGSDKSDSLKTENDRVRKRIDELRNLLLQELVKHPKFVKHKK